MVEYLLIFAVVILIFIGLGKMLTPPLQAIFGKDVWKHLGCALRSLAKNILRGLGQLIKASIRLLDDGLYQFFHRIIYRRPAPPR